MYDIKFIESTHEYFVDDVKKRSVTTILKEENMFNFLKFQGEQYHLERGKNVHAIARYYLEKRLDESTIDEAYLGYFEAIKSFMKDFNPKIIAVEKIVYSPTWDFIGTLDFVCQINEKIILCDWKTSQSMMRWMGLQLAGYKIAWDENEKKSLRIKERWGVQLSYEGKYKIHVYNCASDQDIFICTSKVNKWKQLSIK
jgi:hypothetical protein